MLSSRARKQVANWTYVGARTTGVISVFADKSGGEPRACSHVSGTLDVACEQCCLHMLLTLVLLVIIVKSCT